MRQVPGIQVEQLTKVEQAKVWENFSPLDLESFGLDLHLWFRGDKGITKNGSNVVTAWANQAPSSLAGFTAEESYGPLFVADSINGRPGIYFDGTNDYMRWQDAVGLQWGYTTTPRMIVAVFRYAGATSDDRDLICFNIGSGVQHFRPIIHAAGALVGYQWYASSTSIASSFFEYNASGASLPSDFMVIVFQDYSGRNFYIRETGRQLNENRFVATGTSPVWEYATLGQRSYNGFTTLLSKFFKGYLCELIVCDTPSLPVIQLLEGYLANRYQKEISISARAVPATEAVGTLTVTNTNYTLTDDTGFVSGVCSSADCIISAPSVSTQKHNGKSWTVMRITAANAYKIRVGVQTGQYLNGVLNGYFDLMEAQESVTISCTDQYQGYFTITRTSPETARKIAAIVDSASAKTTIVDADTLAMIDSEDSNSLKQLSWSDLKAAIKAYCDTLYTPL